MIFVSTRFCYLMMQVGHEAGGVVAAQIAATYTHRVVKLLVWGFPYLSREQLVEYCRTYLLPRLNILQPVRD